MPRDRIPFKGRESREAQAAAQKRAAQAERVARAKDSIKEAFVKRKQGQDVTENVWGGAPPEGDEDPKKEG